MTSSGLVNALGSRRRLRSELAAIGRVFESVPEGFGAELLLPSLRVLSRQIAEPASPLVVAIVGSTGAGKSTLFNSLIGSRVSKAGPLRPTTKDPVVWTAAENQPLVESFGRVEVDLHPLARSLALVDTPDLDSDFSRHRDIAMGLAQSADAVIVVTTASRYGDAAPWELVASLGNIRMAVVLNRVPSRSSGARNDLVARLRAMSFGQPPLFSIGEQAVVGELLRPQSVQRLKSMLIEWAERMDDIKADRFCSVASDLAHSTGAMAGAIARHGDRLAAIGEVAYRCHRIAADRVRALYTDSPSGWWRRRKPQSVEASVLVEALDHAAASSSVEAGEIDGSPRPNRAPSEIVELVRAGGAWPVDSVGAIFERAARSWAGDPASPFEGVARRLQEAASLLEGMEYPRE